jgi:hypothetical protein
VPIALPPTPTTPTPPTPKASDPAPQSTLRGLAAHIIPVIVRKSVAPTIASFGCPGADPEDPSDLAVLDTSVPDDGVSNIFDPNLTLVDHLAQMIRVPGRDGTVVVFRNEEERALAIRVLATLRESRLEPGGHDDGKPRCGRDCADCALKVGHSRQSSESTSSSSRRGAVPIPIPVSARNPSRESLQSRSSSPSRYSYPIVDNDEIRFVVTEEDEAMASAAGPRLSIVDFDKMLPDIDWYSNFMRFST